MLIKKFKLFLVVIILLGFVACETGQEPPRDEIETRIDELLSQMTLEEKVGQMNLYTSSWDLTGPPPEEGENAKKLDQIKSGHVGAMLNVTSAQATREAQELAVENSRLGIPMLFGYDVIHGFKTMFPIPLGEAASWDMDAIELSARTAALEASSAGIHWTFAPMVDIARDARWGRIMEGAGEDPYLGSRVAAARVKGFQGEDLSQSNTLAACAKHFAAYGLAEAGLDYNTVDISDQTLHNVTLPPFKAAADAGVATFMNAFNEIGGIPATGSKYLQRDILKGEWDFKGFMVSDWASIGEMIIHGYAEDARAAAKHAVTAGSDMDMESRAYINELVALVESGEVDETLIDDAVRRILRVKFKLGLFDDPYKYSDEEREKNNILTEETQEIARDVARKSIVLLKNENRILPLSEEIKTIAVIGPLAADKDTPLGSWRGQAITNSAVSLLEGIQEAVGEGTQVVHAEGAPLAVGERSFVTELNINEDDRSGFPEAIEAARNAEVVVMALGEDCWQTGEGRSQVDIGLAGVQKELLEEVYKVNQNLVVVLMNGRPLVINWMAENVPGIIESWHLGSQAGNAIADVLFGKYNPSGKLPVSFPRAVGQEPLYYNHKNTGRPTGGEMVFWSHYTDERKDALYPFGYGLSYTTFEYQGLELSTAEMAMDGSLEVTVTVSNTGDLAGEEVVQLYIRDLVGSYTRPVMELKGFQKVHFEPGETKEVTFELTSEDLAFYTPEGEWKAEPGDFRLFAGTNSKDVMEADFTLQ